MNLKFKLGNKLSTIPDGEYLARVKDARKTSSFGKPKLEMEFEITDGDHHGAMVKAFVNANYEVFSEHTKLYRWLLIANRGADLGDEISIQTFFDKLFRVRIESNTSRKTKNVFSNVTEILECVGDI